MNEKIEQAQCIVREGMAKAKNPVMMLSFGKDSMVMLDLFERAGIKLPVIYWRLEHSFPIKNRFANEMIEKHDLEVYDYPATRIEALWIKDQVEIIYNYLIDQKGKMMAVPAGVVPPKPGEKFLCGYQDMYLKPIGGLMVPWDVFFLGHKNSDTDPLQGAIPLKNDIEELDGPTLAFPIRHFTDADIWEYTEKFGVDQNWARYRDRLIEHDNDYYPACTACMRKDAPEQVFCPKTGGMIDRVAEDLVWVDSIRPAYFGDK